MSPQLHINLYRMEHFSLRNIQAESFLKTFRLNFLYRKVLYMVTLTVIMSTFYDVKFVSLHILEARQDYIT